MEISAGWTGLLGTTGTGTEVLVDNKCKHNQFIIVFLVCSRRARQEATQLQKGPRMCLYWEKSAGPWEVVGWRL